MTEFSIRSCNSAQANGAMERFYCRLKDSLRAWLAGSDWVDHLPWSFPACGLLRGKTPAYQELSGSMTHLSPFLGSYSPSEPPRAVFIQQLCSSLPCVADKTGSGQLDPVKTLLCRRTVTCACSCHWRCWPYHLHTAALTMYRSRGKILCP